MTTISVSAHADFAPKSAGHTAAGDTAHRDVQFLGRLTGLMFIATFATAIPPVVTFYVPALSDPAFVLGGGFDTGVSWGALLELLLILSNVATAIALYPVLKRRFPVLSLGFVAARLIESVFIAVGIVALMALNTLRIEAGGADPDALVVVGKALVAVHDWTFRMGPGIVVGVGNGLILGFMMWRTRLVPRYLSVLGLIGGSALLAAGAAILFGAIDIGSTLQVIATAPEFVWELSLGFWLLVRGFDTSALKALDAGQVR